MKADYGGVRGRTTKKKGSKDTGVDGPKVSCENLVRWKIAKCYYHIILEEYWKKGERRSVET